MRALLLSLLLALPLPATAQHPAAAQARAAIGMLDEARMQLDAAQSARDRVRALTRTIQAFEEGLAAMRGGLRQAAIREAQLSAALQARDAEVAALLAVLQRTGAGDAPLPLLHPGGLLGAARANMLLAEITPALSARAVGLRRDMEDLVALRAVQDDASGQLQGALTDLRAARSALNTAIAERAPLPMRFTQDPVREAILLASADTLESFARGLDRVPTDITDAALPDVTVRKGTLPLPAQGVVLRRAGQPDAAGITRPGLLLATRPQAIVTSPVAATIRYTGPLLDLGQVVIMEPQADVLFILAGLDVVYGSAGEIIDAGAPLGLMGERGAQEAVQLSRAGDGTGSGRSETLYIEVRHKNAPEDPSLWFRTDKNG
ncbi:peptidase M23 [uncultured Roseobacter sp.]|uniref:murein hydrolase activator EnvC family protein n=1 Tax=uncultured Roseobacter sp. TaxID=114847 RepID=UPI00262618B7|nr:peptidase M23 [uncultured Roseobacter sp.]